MDFESSYEIATTASFIHSNKFSRVALQFPDELLKYSTRVVSAVREKLRELKELDAETNGDDKDVGLYVMADTMYGSCCIDEVGASHINADCVIHFGHTCLSPTSTLPAYVVFGKASVSISNCIEDLSSFALTSSKPIVVLYGLEYSHAIPHIREALLESSNLEIHFADVMSSIVNPLKDVSSPDGIPGPTSEDTTNSESCAAAINRFRIGGLFWELPEGLKIEDYLLFWIGSDNSAFANVVLTFNGCEIVRYDVKENCLVRDFSQQRRILKRRYYQVEKAKDANIVAILVGTLGVAGYLHMIHQMKELITRAGKKVYTLAMGRPNPAKLANFPECDVFIYVSCAQTALLDSKEFLAPVITPFEAMLAFNRGSQWTGEYVMEFRDLINLSQLSNESEEPRFSFLQGGYIENNDSQENGKEDYNDMFALTNATEDALQKSHNSLTKRTATSVAEFYAARSYHGLEMNVESSLPEPYFIGRSGKASGYMDEKSR